jgi:hypothetical protein
MAAMMADRRTSPRHVLTLVAEVTDSLNSTVLNARLSDVSRTGSFIDTLTPLAQDRDPRWGCACTAERKSLRPLRTSCM